MVNDATIFSNIPICALVNDKKAPILSEEECIFDKCSDDNAQVISHEYITSIGVCHSWKKNTDYDQPAIYLSTIHFPKTNQQMHLLELEDGNYVFAPDTHITWGEAKPEQLPGYNQ